jgi:hypothetical protein
MRRIVPIVVFVVAAMAWTVLGYQGPAGGDASDKGGPPAKAADAIFVNANVITISGPMAGGKTVTVEGVPVGTTKWIQGNPFGGGIKEGLVGPQAQAGPDPALEAWKKDMETKQSQILQIVLDLQKQLGKTLPK